jgi:hypothetical protein
MLGYPPVKCVNENNLDSLISELVQNEYSIYQLNGEEIYDLKTFYNQCIEILPQNPPLTKGSSVNLDAFMDSIWEGISEQESDKIAIIWTKTENIAKHNLSDLLKITQIFYDISTTLNKDYGLDRTINFLIFLVITERNFADISGK